jgi:hypothetical protein
LPQPFKLDVHRISNFDPVYSENDLAVIHLINQGDALLASLSINWLKLALTYAFPIQFAPSARSLASDHNT